MKIFDTLLLDMVLISLPISIYLLYLAYTKTFNTKENNLLLTVTIFSILYLILKYTHPLYENLPFLIINIPLLIAYIKKTKQIILPASIVIVLYYYSFYQNFLFILIAEYIFYYLLYLKTYNKIKPYQFILIFTIIKTFITMIIINYSRYNINYLLETSVEGLILYILSVIIIILLNKTESILKLHMNIKEIKQNKQIHTSLFKVTHEIKNPIAVCKGYLDMFDENNPDHLKKYIPILKEEIDRTLILLEDFLAMNQVKINKDIIDINLLLEDVINNIEMLCQKNGIKLEKDIIDDDIYINADYNRLMQVFINLFKNSIEAIPKEKQGKIKVEEKLEKNNIIITIIDNGKGMNKELLNKIKEPFYTTKQKGTGLGVSLSDQIIKAHDGILTYESKEGEYTKVKIILPKENS